jgi:hypothetical protein
VTKRLSDLKCVGTALHLSAPWSGLLAPQTYLHVVVKRRDVLPARADIIKPEFLKADYINMKRLMRYNATVHRTSSLQRTRILQTNTGSAHYACLQTLRHFESFG